MPSPMSRGNFVTLAGWTTLSMLKALTSCHVTPVMSCITSDLQCPLTSL